MLEMSTGCDEVFCGPSVALGEIAAGVHEVDEVVSPVHSVEGGPDRLGILDVSASHFH
jgi:hypothetical protein